MHSDLTLFLGVVVLGFVTISVFVATCFRASRVEKAALIAAKSGLPECREIEGTQRKRLRLFGTRKS